MTVNRKCLDIEKRIKEYIEANTLITEGQDIIAGVSGGADSMVLLHFLHTYREYYKITLQVAHIDHGVREEATQDALYVQKKCKEWQIKFHLHCCNIKEIASEEKITEEEAGREERYRFFRSLKKDNSKIAVAHNKNDQAETMIMRFLRGADVKGLGGIKCKRDDIIRPLLDLSREEIEYYCKYYGIDYKDDHTNFMPVYTRNKIRLECIPYIEENFNSNIVNTLSELSVLYQEEEAFLSNYIKEIKCSVMKYEEGEVKIMIDSFNELELYIRKRIILDGVQQISGGLQNVGRTHVEAVMNLCENQTGRRIHLPHGVEAYRNYAQLCIAKKQIDNEKAAYEYVLVEGKNESVQAPYDIELTVLPSSKTFEQTNQNRYTKYIDYDKIKDKLCLRTRKPKDRITLAGGSKKLKKFFVDEKIPSKQRDIMPLIADGSDIIWVVGSRLNTNYYVTGMTKNILKIQAKTKQGTQEGLC